jgi:hypothetical protein
MLWENQEILPQIHLKDTSIKDEARYPIYKTDTDTSIFIGCRKDEFAGYHKDNELYEH